MIHDRIKKWIRKGGSYRDGYYLLQKVGADEKVMQRLKSGLDLPYVRSDLKQLLTDSLGRVLDIVPDGRRIIVAGDEPKAVRDLRDEAKLLHKEHAFLKARLSMLGSDPERYEVADQIMSEIIPKLDAIYDRIREFENTGSLPVSGREEIVQETVKKFSRINSLKPRISRLKKWIKQTSTPAEDRQKYEKELAEKEADLAELETELGLSD